MFYCQLWQRNKALPQGIKETNTGKRTLLTTVAEKQGTSTGIKETNTGSRALLTAVAEKQGTSTGIKETNTGTRALLTAVLTPECIQLQRSMDGRATGEAIVCFPSRVEAERAVLEKNRQHIGNRYIELYLI
uniref:RRM domain-containing protein n=1 Tax=Timema poppense TaxID=170557 RepID=A0A7R9H3S8_TIMPO|nr:unnamed protein product [Timema poppensis]